MMGKCFICGEEVPLDHACLNAQVHMYCEGKLADFARLREECERLQARIVWLEKALGFAKDAPLHTQEWLRKNDIKFTNLKSHWQKVGFSIYTDLCEVADTAAVALEEPE